MRAAIIHYWLLNMRGGEKVVEALLRLLPEADIFTLFYDPERVIEAIVGLIETPEDEVVVGAQGKMMVAAHGERSIR